MRLQPHAVGGRVLARRDTDKSGLLHGLGACTARVGRDLAQAFGTGNVAAAEIVARIGDRLRGAAREPLLPALSARVGRAAGVGRVPVQRVHGDLHLAQALFSGGR